MSCRQHRLQSEPQWERLVLSTAREFTMILDEQQTLVWSQAGRDEVANGFVEDIVERGVMGSEGILDLLLGCEQAQIALDSIADGRDWQGNLTAQLQQKHERQGCSHSVSSKVELLLDKADADVAPTAEAKGVDNGPLDASCLAPQPQPQSQPDAALPQPGEASQQGGQQSAGPASEDSGVLACPMLLLPPKAMLKDSKRDSCPGAIPQAISATAKQRTSDCSVHKGCELAHLGRSLDSASGSQIVSHAAKGSQCAGGPAPTSKAQAWSLSQSAMERLRNSSATSNNNRTIAMLESVMGASSASNALQQHTDGCSREQLQAEGTRSCKPYGPMSSDDVSTLHPSAPVQREAMRKSLSASSLLEHSPASNPGGVKQVRFPGPWEDKCKAGAKPASLSTQSPASEMISGRAGPPGSSPDAGGSSVGTHHRRHRSAIGINDPWPPYEWLCSHPVSLCTSSETMDMLDCHKHSSSAGPDTLPSMSSGRRLSSLGGHSPESSCYASPASSFPSSPMPSLTLTEPWPSKEVSFSSGAACGAAPCATLSCVARESQGPCAAAAHGAALPAVQALWSEGPARTAAGAPTARPAFAAAASAAVSAWSPGLEGTEPAVPMCSVAQPGGGGGGRAGAAPADSLSVASVFSVPQELVEDGCPAAHSPRAPANDSDCMQAAARELSMRLPSCTSSADADVARGLDSTADLTVVPLTLPLEQDTQQQQEQQQQLLQVDTSFRSPLSRPCSWPEQEGLEVVMEEGSEGEEQSQELAQPACFQTYFEVTIKPAMLPDGRRAAVVSVVDNTEQIQIQAALSELAEAQLALLAGIMPHHALQFLALESTAAVPRNAAALAREHKGCTIMFMDIVGFTSMCKVVPPHDVLFFLNHLFSICDRLTDKHGVHKVETAGDCYIVSGGIMATHPTNGFLCTMEEIGVQEDPHVWARQVHAFAKDLLLEAKKVCMPHTGEPVNVRIGIHSGDVVSGLIGTKLPKFSLFGDTMNTSARMESTGVPGRIHVSSAAHALLASTDGSWEPTGGVEVKGKGFMQTYLWVPPESSPPPSPADPASPRATLAPTPQEGTEGSPQPLLASPPAARTKEASSPTTSGAAQLPARTMSPPACAPPADSQPGPGRVLEAAAAVVWGGTAAAAAASAAGGKIGGSARYFRPPPIHTSLRQVASARADLAGQAGKGGEAAAGGASTVPPSLGQKEKVVGFTVAASSVLSYSSQAGDQAARILEAKSVSSSSGGPYRSSQRYSRRFSQSRDGAPRTGSLSFEPLRTEPARDIGSKSARNICLARRSLDRHLLCTRFLSQRETRSGANDLQHVMDSFHEFNHLAILGGLSEYGTGGSLEPPQGSIKDDPLQVILRALPVQGMNTPFAQSTMARHQLYSPSPLSPSAKPLATHASTH